MPVIVTAPAARALRRREREESLSCLLYTSDAADEEDSVDLGGRRIIKKKIFSSIRRQTR